MAYQDLYNSYGGVNSMMGTDPYDTGEPDTQANTQPVTQTIKFDPVTGEQQMTIKGRPEDLSPANPNTPTLMMPGQTAPAAAPAPAMMPAAPAPATEQTQSNYNPESIAQALQQAGLSYVPPQPIATLAQAGTSDVNPPAVTMPPAATTVPQTTMPTGGLRMPTPAAVAPMAAPAPMTAQPSAAPAPVAPGPPAMDGAALTRQSESGGDYNVGYNRAGTTDAYGVYQILSSTYKGIQAADPYFQGKDQKSLSPADQDRANNVLRNLNSQGLASQGVEATEPNIQLAHYLGATGASEYLKTGYISPEAAAANGGYEAADKIARDRIRMAGGNPDGIPKNAQLSAQDITEFANNKQLGPLMDIYKKNPTSPEGRAALASITTIQTQEADLIKAKKQIENAMTSSRGNAEIGKLLTAQKEEGSWGKYLLAGLLGMGDIAKAEGVKLGLNNTWSSVQLADGTSGMVQMRGDGLPVQGITSKGAMTASELAESVGGAGGKTKPDVSTQDVQKGDLKGRVVTTYDRNNRPTTFVESGGKRYAYDSSWTPVSIGTAAAKAEQGAAIKLRYAGPMAYTEAGAKAAGEHNFQYGTNIGYAAQVPGAPLVDLNTGRVVTPDANGNISVTQTQAPGRGPGAVAPGAVAPDVVRPPAVVSGMTKSNQEYSDKLADNKATAGSQKSTINRIQSSIDRNPEFWGIDTNSPTWRAFVDVNSTNADRGAALNTLARNLNINPDKRADFDQTMNDYRNLQVNAITGSGLSASQTNTEKEGERVIGTIGSIGDKPAAAKATLEFARAKIEYTEAKARAWIEARRKNPGLDRLEFEDTFDQNQGEKIFADANKRMEKILEDARKKQPGATPTGTTAERPLTPQELAQQELQRRRKEKQ